MPAPAPWASTRQAFASFGLLRMPETLAPPGILIVTALPLIAPALPTELALARQVEERRLWQACGSGGSCGRSLRSPCIFRDRSRQLRARPARGRACWAATSRRREDDRPCP